VALVTLPAAALATRPAEPANGNGNAPTQPGNGHKPTEGTGGEGNGPQYSPESPPAGQAYGYYCQGESKKHVAGTRDAIQHLRESPRNGRRPPEHEPRPGLQGPAG
jgi:hypothetical protein